MQNLTTKQTLNGAGQTTPPIPISLDAMQASRVTPAFAVTASADADFLARLEVTFDNANPDGTYPATTTWLPLTDSFGTTFTGSMGLVGAGSSRTGLATSPNFYANVLTNYAAIRMTMLTYIAGSVTLAVRQVIFPEEPGESFR